MHLSTALSNPLNKSQQHQEEHSWEPRESNPGLMGEKQDCYLCAIQTHQPEHTLLQRLSLLGLSAKASYEDRF